VAQSSVAAHLRLFESALLEIAAFGRYGAPTFEINLHAARLDGPNER
jgi:hypothetical protein